MCVCVYVCVLVCVSNFSFLKSFYKIKEMNNNHIPIINLFLFYLLTHKNIKNNKKKTLYRGREEKYSFHSKLGMMR